MKALNLQKYLNYLPTWYWRNHARDPYEAKYQFLLNKRKNLGWKHYNNSKALIKHSDNMDYLYKNIEEYNHKIWIWNVTYWSFFYYIIAFMFSNKNLQQIVTELFPRSSKLNISPVLLHNTPLLYQKTLD